MPDGFEGSDVIGMGVAAALARQYSQEQREFLPMIAKILKDSMPEQVEVLEAGLFKKTIRGVVIDQGGNRLTLEDSGRGPLRASFTRIVKGIALKTEPLTVEEWLTCVSDTLEKTASENAAARASLARTLGLD